MARTWGKTWATFLTLGDDQFVQFTHGGSSAIDTVVPNSVTWTRRSSAIGDGAASFYALSGWENWLVPGRCCVITQEVSGYTGITERLLACFMIEEVEPRTAGGIPMVDIRGPGVESLLTKAAVFHPIGALVVTDSTLAEAVVAPRNETLAADAPAGVENVILGNSDSGDTGQEIRITMAGGAGVHVTHVTARTLIDGTFHLILADRMPAAALSGAAVSIRKRTVKPQSAHIEAFTPGVEAWVTLNGGATFKTLVAQAVNEAGYVTLRDGLTAAASGGNGIDARAYSGVATDDVTQIIGYMPGTWSVDFQTGNGTAAGSTHTPEGESVFDLLSSLAERTGEFFRLKIVNHIPYYALQWRRTPDASGVMLVMYGSGEEWQQEADETNASRGALLSVRHKTAQPLINRIYPATGDQTITLAACTAGALADALAAGCSVHISTDFYEPDYVEYSASVSQYGVRSVRQTFGDISIADSESLEELQNASDALLAAAVQSLTQARLREYYTVEAFVPAVALAPGQTVRILNDVTEPIVDQADYVILEITERQAQGVPRTTLTVSNILGPQVNAATNFAKTVRSLVQSQRRVGAAGANISVAAGGGGSGGVTDHGLLTGLTDDDHPQYLLASGARALAGNLAVNAGATVDGVDISAHAANPDAHHARAYAADVSLTVNAGQGISVASAFAGPGLALAGGILSAQVSAALGTQIATDVIGVLADPLGGLLVGAAGVKVRLPANSGVAVDATGVYLAPSTITATSTNSVSGSSHFHAVTATDNAKAAPAQILKSSAAGDLTVRFLTADQITTPLLLTAAGSLRIDPAGALTIHDGDMQFVGARAISTDTGSLTLAPAGGLFIDPVDNNAQVQPSVTLKTANWVSGFLGTGWGMTYAGHLDTRSIYADELHVAAFIADTARVAVGAEYITPGMAIIAASFTIPGVGSSGTLYVEDAPGLTDLPVFADGDWVLLRVMDRPAGGLLVANAWGQVYGYADRDDGQQQWTFTTRSVDAAAVGEKAPRGAIALDFGKSGDGWWWVTTLDPAGSPYAGITTWQGANPYTDGNRTHRLRMGQLSGVTGAHEWGLQAGNLASSFVRFSDLRSEIHGSRLSLYAADGGRLQVGAVDVVFYRAAAQSSTMTPNADHSSLNIETSGATFYGMVDEGATSPNYGDYIHNAYNLPGYVFLGLTNPAAFTSIHKVEIRAALQSLTLTNDKIRIYGQVFQSDETTPLTGEVLLWEATAHNVTTSRTVAAPHEGYDADKPAQWNGARLRLRWEYEISTSEEAIRLDPNVPSLAVGNPLPTGFSSGGPGFWTGLEGGAYLLRIGTPGAQRFTWTGAELQLINAANEPVIVAGASGHMSIAGVLSVGAAGGIWQGTGSFAAPTTGLKIYNTGGAGRLSTYNAGLEQITLNTAGQLVAGAGAITLDRLGLDIRVTSAFSHVGAVNYVDTGALDATRITSPTAFNMMRLRVDKANAPSTIAASILLTHAAGEAQGSVTVNASNFVVEGAARISERLEVGVLPIPSAVNGIIRTENGIYIGGGLVVGNANQTAPAAGDVVAGGGLALGDVTLNPLSATLLLKERAAVGNPPADTAHLWLQDVGGVQKLYVKFANGVQRELATA